ncbi:MAG: pyridoxine 5'-phosphate synthase [Candidatus Pelagibacter sp.]
MSIRLGVNIDHVATIRKARGDLHPEPYIVAKKALQFGANSITIHLREDRRHINDNDLKIISSIKSIPLNLEMACNSEMLKMAIKYKPDFVCIVPEKRNEVTTEGGLNLKKNKNKLKSTLKILNKNKIRTSLFINPTKQDVKISKLIKAKCVELHTGKISNKIKKKKNYIFHLKKIKDCANYARSLGLEVHAGHGMDYKTAKILTKVRSIKEFNIGHFIIGESIIYGLKKTIENFKKILK